MKGVKKTIVAETEVEKNSPEPAKAKSEKFEEEKIIFLDKYANKFSGGRKDIYEVPNYDFVDKYDLKKLDETVLENNIYEAAHLDTFSSSGYPFTVENRLSEYQDFTLFVMNDYSYNVIYCVLDKNNRVVCTLTLAYKFAEGEYSELAFGEFIAEREYYLQVEGVADPYEESDGTVYEGSSRRDEKYFAIEEDGAIIER